MRASLVTYNPYSQSPPPFVGSWRGEATGGNGVFSGEGYTIMPSMFSHAKLRVHWENITINTDYRMIEGWVDAVSDIKNSQIANLDESGPNTQQNGIVVDFAIPENPEYYYDAENGTITIIDAEGNPHEIALPKDSEGNVIFPVTITDSQGNSYVVTKDEDVNTSVEQQENLLGNSAGSGSETDNSIYFIVKKLKQGEEPSCKFAENIVNETQENEYIQYGTTLTRDEGTYILIPIRKNIQYTYNSELITKRLKDFNPCRMTSGEVSFKPLTWPDNPYNIYEIENNKTSTPDARYMIIEVNAQDEYVIRANMKIGESSPRVDYGDWNSIENVRKIEYDDEDPNFKKYISIPYPPNKYSITIKGKKLESEAVWFDYINEYTYDGTFGFDVYDENKLSTFKNKYEDKFDIKKADGRNIEYITPYVSAWAGQEVTLKAKIKKNVSDGKLHYKFESSTGLTVICNHASYTNIMENGVSVGIFEAENGDYDLEITIKSSVKKATLSVKDKNDKLVGKLCLYTKPPTNDADIKYKVVNVTFGNAPSTIVDINNYIEGSPLSNYLNNKSFNQAFLQFKYDNEYTELSISDNLTKGIGFVNNQLDSTKINLKRIRKLLEAEYKNQGKVIRDNERVIFLINNQEMLGAGAHAPTPNERNISGYSIVVYKKSLTSWGVFVHELGHTFSLQHPFGNNVDGNTVNYMERSYSPKRNMFWEWQWGIINNKNDFKEEIK